MMIMMVVMAAGMVVINEFCDNYCNSDWSCL